MNKRRAALVGLILATLSACASGKSSGAGSPQPSAAAEASHMPNCNGEAPVWAIEGPKRYLLPGDPHYGRTQHARFMCRSQANALGYRPARPR
ncbi:MAG: hypothetical protein WBE79_07485 [Candidatus Cybelea sp.]